MIYRMVYEQNGREEQSTVVLAATETSEHIKLEASMHLFGGWAVTLFGAQGDEWDETADPLFHEGDVTQAVMVSPRGMVRRVWCREFDPAEDGV